MYYVFIRTAGSILGTGINTFISDWDRVTSAASIGAIMFSNCSTILGSQSRDILAQFELRLTKITKKRNDCQRILCK
jgi:hypothetical protein